MKPEVRLIEVTENDIDFLYELLKERPSYPKEFGNLTANEIPSFDLHSNFVFNYLQGKGYAKWFVILYEDKKVGSIALKPDGEWGYHILIDYWDKGIGQEALSKLIALEPNRKYIATINPNNKRAMHIAEKFGHKLVGLIYER